MYVSVADFLYFFKIKEELQKAHDIADMYFFVLLRYGYYKGVKNVYAKTFAYV